MARKKKTALKWPAIRKAIQHLRSTIESPPQRLSESGNPILPTALITEAIRDLQRLLSPSNPEYAADKPPPDLVNCLDHVDYGSDAESTILKLCELWRATAIHAFPAYQIVSWRKLFWTSFLKELLQLVERGTP